ncbi:23S rRNA (pseudouridine(1915)-N(3))-methyltransferase RlmH, partial [candidate division KSB1 bacterium]
MQIHLIAVGKRMPHWVQQGYEEYAKRMPKECALILKEITAAKRQKNSDLQRLIKDEGERLLAALPPQAYVVALDRQGV